MPDDKSLTAISPYTNLQSWTDDEILAAFHEAVDKLDEHTVQAVEYLTTAAYYRRLDVGFDTISHLEWSSRGLGAASSLAEFCSDPRIPFLESRSDPYRLYPSSLSEEDAESLLQQLRLPESLADEQRPAAVEAAVNAARYLGHFRVREAAHDILELIPQVGGTPQLLVVVALEQAGDATMAAEVQELLPTLNDYAVFWLARALRRWTGHSPLWPEAETWHDSVAIFRRELAQIDYTQPPRPNVDFRSSSSTETRASVIDGTDLFALEDDYETRPAYSSWPVPSISWTQFHKRLYQLGWNVCETCEVYLLRVGWAPDEAIAAAQVAREALVGVESLEPGVLDALRPIITSMATGEYDIRLVDQRLTAVTFDKTWYARHTNTYDFGHFGPLGHATGEIPPLLYQPPEPSYLVIAPTQPPSVLNSRTVDGYIAQIKAGHHPAILVAAHATERCGPEDSVVIMHSLTGFVIDGHHKLAAYDALGVPARIIWICDMTPRLAPGYEPVRELFDEFLGTQSDTSAGALSV